MSFQLLYKILNKGIEKIANYVIQRVIKAFFDSPKMNYQNFSRKVHFKMHKFMVDICIDDQPLCWTQQFIFIVIKNGGRPTSTFLLVTRP